MSFKPLLGFLSLLAGLLCSGAWSQTAKPATLRAWNIHPDGYPVTEALKSFAIEVEKASNGKFKIEVFSNAVLGDQPKAVQMLKSGELDVAEFSSGPLSEAAPGLKAFNLPFLFNDSAHMFRHLDGKLGEQLAARLKESGFVVLGWYDGGARSFYCSNRPITNARHLAGQKIRVQQSEIYIEMVKSLGATPISMPYKDVLDGLETGKIDCAENNLPSYESTGHYKFAKYVYLTNHVISPEALVVSTKLWERLSGDEKALFLKAGKDSALLMRILWNQRVKEARELVTKNGSQIERLADPAPFVRKMGGLYGKYMADPQTGKELISIIGN